MVFWSIIGILSVGFVLFRFVKALGNRIPILELMLLIAGLQWVIGAVIEYLKTEHHYKYYMYVDESTYMSYVVPAYLIFVFATLYGVKKETKNYFNPKKFIEYSRFGILIFSVGVISDFLRPEMPGSLQFVFFLLSNFKYVGSLMLLFSNNRINRYIFYGSLVYLFFASLRGGFFHDFILWGTFFYIFWTYKIKPTLKLHILVLLIGILGMTAIQMVKADYRKMIWSGYDGDELELFVDILETRLVSTSLVEDDGPDYGELNERLNQGWIISAILKNTPEKQPYGYGTTIIDALWASALPRFLDEDKKEATGRQNFTKYTGMQLAEGTSMGISIVGEAYANFGVYGGIIFMGFWGFFIAMIWKYLWNKTTNYPILLFFLPLIFLQVVKAESELLSVLNHLIKCLLLVILFLNFVRKVLKWELRNTTGLSLNQ